MKRAVFLLSLLLVVSCGKRPKGSQPVLTVTEVSDAGLPDADWVTFPPGQAPLKRVPQNDFLQ